jgi:iron complex outermembrane receptor protein
MRMKLFFFAFLTAVAGVCGEQAAALRGVISDPSLRAVPDAVVALYARESSVRVITRSRADGAYEFRGLAAGVYLLHVEAAGFAGLTTEEIRLEAGVSAVRDVSLGLARLRSEVMVTASATPMTIEEIAKAADVVPGEEAALRVEYSVPESLRLLPGFRVRQLGGPGGLTNIQVRGLRNYDTALLVDGLRMRDASDLQGSAQPQWEDLLLVASERAEVLRGTGAPLYGSHATGGVVNLVSDQGGGKAHGEALAEGGGLGLFRGLLRAGGGALGDRLVYSGGVTHLNVTGGLDGVNPYRNTSGQGFVKYRFAPGIAWSGRAFLSDAFAQVGDPPYVAPELEANLPAKGVVPGRPLPDGQVARIEQGLPFESGQATYVPGLNDPDSRRAGAFSNVATTFSQQLRPSLSWQASYQFLDTGRRYDDGPGGSRWEPLWNNSAQYDGRVHIAQARAGWQIGRHNLVTGGYEFESEEYDNRNLDQAPGAPAANRANIRQRSHSVFLQDQVSLLDRRLHLGFAGRAQAFRLEDPTFEGGASPYQGARLESPQTAYTGDVSAAYLVRRTGTKLRAHAGNAYRAPSAYERFGSSFFFGSFSPFGDPRLRPERSLSFDGGVDQWLARSRVRLSATYFYTALQEVILFDFSGLIPPGDPYGRFMGYLNTGGGLARGAEFSAGLQAARGTSLQAAYTYANSDDRKPFDRDGLFFKMPGVSDHVASLLVSQWVGRRLNFTFDLFAASSYPFLFGTTGGARAFEMDGPVKADLVVSYTIPVSDTRSLRFYGKVENLSNSRLYEQGYRAPKLWALGGLRFSF